MNIDKEQINQLTKLLENTKLLVEHQQEIAKLKGENFNLFSILKMESLENKTHSAFLGELLNPNGSHGLGSIFLELFLEIVVGKQNEQGLEKLHNFSSDKAELFLEKGIGKRNDSTAEGGRIDILITDGLKNISIENKIYANDQNAQMARYVNFNKDNNVVLYLTLDGHDASEGSRGEYKDGKDYFCISYQEHIINWLELCQKETTDFPIIRETIKQYIILIKKLTNQLSDTKMNDQLHELIKTNYEAARLLDGKVRLVELKELRKFLIEVKENFLSKIGEGSKDWQCDVADHLEVKNSGITITNKNWDGISLKINGEPLFFKDTTTLGLLAHENDYSREDILNKVPLENLREDEWITTPHFPRYVSLDGFNTPERKAIIFNPDERNNLCEDYALRLVELAQLCEEPLKKVKRITR